MTVTNDAEGLRKYRLIAEIGKGGMADVFLAVVQGPAGFNKLVVIKKTRSELSPDPEFVAMFLDEARLAARLNHPNVVQTHEVGQDRDRYYIAMEYLDGQPLNKVRSRAGRAFPLSMQARVLADVLAGLHHAHELADFDGTPLGVVHRDATPQNVFVTYEGVVKIVDFGIAKAVDSSMQTRAGVVKGKVSYMSPEQAHGDKVDRRTDVFAVGVMLWEGIVGHRMWKGVADIVVLTSLAQGKIPSVHGLVPDAPPGLVAICEKALSPKPEDRYQTAAEMHEALEAWIAATDDRPSARDVGKFVAEHFGDERAKVKAVIETQLRDVRWSGSYPKMTGVDLPKIDPGQVMVTPTGNRALDSKGAERILTPIGTSSLTASSMTSGAEPPRDPPAPRQSKPLVLVAVGGFAAVGVIVLGVRLFAPAPPPMVVTVSATTDTAPRETAIASAPLPTPAQEAVKLVVRVTPSSAKVLLDGAVLSIGPFEGKLVKGDKPRKVRVEASGYAAKEEIVKLEGDLILSFALEKEAASPAPQPPPVAARPRPVGEPVEQPAAPAPLPPAAAPPPAPTAAPATSGQKPKRKIETDSPYAN